MLFFLKKLISPFFLPPGLFILFLFSCSVLAWWRGHRLILKYLLPSALIIWLFSMWPFANILIRPLETAYPIPKAPQADVIIMLTGGIYKYAPDLSGTGAPGPATVERLVTAARLHRLLTIPIIVSGGKVYPNEPAISSLTKRFLIDLGVAPDQIIEEDRSRDTLENAMFSKEICLKKDYARPLLVTSACHMRRSVFCFDRAGLKVTPFPCAITTWKGMDVHWSSWLPSSRALYTTSSAMHEWLGLLFYRLAY